MILCQLCAQWQAQVRSIPSAYVMASPWGPSETELVSAVKLHVSARFYGWDEDHVSEARDGNLSEDREDHIDEDEDGDGDGIDNELMEAIESVALTSAYPDDVTELLFN